MSWLMPISLSDRVNLMTNNWVDIISLKQLSREVTTSKWDFPVSVQSLFSAVAVVSSVVSDPFIAKLHDKVEESKLILLLGTLILVIFPEVLLNVSDKILANNSVLHLIDGKSFHL